MLEAAVPHALCRQPLEARPRISSESPTVFPNPFDVRDSGTVIETPLCPQSLHSSSSSSSSTSSQVRQVRDESRVCMRNVFWSLAAAAAIVSANPRRHLARSERAFVPNLTHSARPNETVAVLCTVIARWPPSVRVARGGEKPQATVGRSVGLIGNSFPARSTTKTAEESNVPLFVSLRLVEEESGTIRCTGQQSSPSLPSTTFSHCSCGADFRLPKGGRTDGRTRSVSRRGSRWSASVIRQRKYTERLDKSGRVPRAGEGSRRRLGRISLSADDVAMVAIGTGSHPSVCRGGGVSSSCCPLNRTPARTGHRAKGAGGSMNF